LGDAAIKWAALGDVAHAGQAMERLGSGHFASGAIELGLQQNARAVEMVRPIGDKWRLMSALNNLGFNLALTGDSSTAKPLLDEALQLARQCDDPHSVANILDSIAEVEMSLGRFKEARSLWQECFSIAMRLNDKRQIPYVLERRARLALLEGDAELCIRLASASEAARSATGEIASQDLREIVVKTVEDARHQLPELVSDAAWREGKTMTLEEVIASVVLFDSDQK
jgi:tetratricopeptide (TPR) repeat protein